MRTRILRLAQRRALVLTTSKKRTDNRKGCLGGIFAFGEYILALRLTSELVDLRAGYANSHSALCAEASSRPHHKQKRTDNRKGCLFFFGRSGGTRTRGLQYPKLARYQLRYTSFGLFLSFCFLRRCFCASLCLVIISNPT